MQCDFITTEQGGRYWHSCRNCQRVVSSDRPNAVAECKRSPSSSGVGTQLNLLLARIGISDEPGCPCKQHAAEMNSRGCQWCRENEATIIGWMREEAERRGLPFVDLVARQLVRLAIRRAERTS